MVLRAGFAEMHRRAVFLSAAVWGISLLSSQSPAGEITAKELRAHVEVLASERMEGRLTGGRGVRAASNYVADRFREIGLTPAGSENFFHSFEYPAGVTLLNGNGLAFDFAGVSYLAKLGSDWRPLAFSHPGKAKASPVVFAGYGIVASEALRRAPPRSPAAGAGASSAATAAASRRLPRPIR